MGFKKSTYVKLVLIACLCIILCAAFAVGTTQPFNHIDDYDAATDGWTPITARSRATDVQSASQELPAAELSSTTIDPASIQSVSINWAAGTVEVYPVKDSALDGQILIREYVIGGSARMPQMSVSDSNGMLSIDYNAGISSFLFGCSFGSKHLVVEVPADAMGVMQSFTVDGASGQYSIRGIQTDRLTLHLASGRMNLDGMEARVLDLDVASGRIALSGVFQSVEASLASGQVNMECLEECPQRASFSTMSGKFVLTIPEDSDFKAEVDKMSGAFTCGFPAVQRDGTYQWGEGTNTMDISIMSGSFDLQPLAQ